MMRWLLAVLLMSGAAQADVLVRSGEHGSYTRLAFDLPTARAWRMGRVADGYALRLDPAVTLDMSRIYRRIGRGRIAGVGVDAATGDVLLRLGCACYATAFESRPGTVVIDVHPGAAKPGSRFELSLDPPPPPKPVVRTAGYDWTDITRTPPDLPMAPALDPFRDAVLRQLAAGAARGVVDMVDRPPPLPPLPLPEQVRIAEEPGFVADPDQPLTTDGLACIPDADLALGDWGADGPAALTLASGRGGLEGEFDRPDPEAVTRAIRYHLFLGFGAEARQIAQVYAPNAEGRALWSDLGHLVDAEEATAGILPPMAGCDGAAALWGILSLPRPQPGAPENAGAALQAFTALPQHLRRDIGPMLVERFTARHDDASAMRVRDAILRAEPAPDAPLRTLTAAPGAEGDSALAAIVAEGGRDTDEARITLADRRLSARQPVDEPTRLALEALLHEARGGPDEARLARLVALARAATQDFDTAFAEAPASTEAELWAWLAEAGGDDAILTHGVLADGTARPIVPREVRLAMARRLTDLGLPDPALRWLDTDPAAAPEDERLIAARAHLARQDGLDAQRWLGGLDTAEATALRTAAARQLAGPSAEVSVPTVAPAQPMTPLAQGRALTADSDAVRQQIEALLTR
ncbi:hypothetical protein [Falsirhodobacter algicola]|uniref:Uncharacterized protein n=1 Tax=Falsirhodobacter algicola TaxID=2692330 RepID=A0A8J8SKX4_9RHOB|nr:hypothetical protein [Falsirhodobacter algicola]QUS35922.1 hypothetical protein GR316_06405 [Falsirhodobacter algicola]